MGMDTMTMGMDTMTMGMDTMTMGMDTMTTSESGPTVWTCPEISFTKEDGTDFTDPANQDFYTENVIITRASTGGQILNFANNDDPLDAQNIPSGVEWAIGRTSDLSNLTFGGFREIIGRPNDNIVDLDLVMHLLEDDIFLNITFTSWSSGREGNGGFSYMRATPGDCDGSPRIPDQPSLSFAVAPTVTNGSLRVFSEDLNADIVSLYIFNQNGIMIEQVRDINTLGGTLNTNIDLGNLEQGMYFIRVIGNNGLSSVQRFIKVN